MIITFRGEIYGYELYEGLEQVDSCWGYNPGSEDIRKIMNYELSGWFGSNIEFDYLADDYFDIEVYLDNQSFPQLTEDITKMVVTQLYEDFQVQVPFPYNMSFDEIRSNKDGVLDSIVDDLYKAYEMPTVESIRSAIFEHAGISRAVQPKLTISDLEPNRDYTADEIMGILNKKPSLADMIAGAEARKGNQNVGHEGHKFER